MKVLNLYAGIGGNRKLWQDVDVTAVEIDSAIAKIYQDYFPNDTVIVGDAHQYLLDHYKEFDFIWSSPPCPSHSKINTDGHTRLFNYPDMKLYQEIIALGNNWFRGLWAVENVIPYYKPLIEATKLERHLYWANFKIGNYTSDAKRLPIKYQSGTNGRFGFNLKGIKIDNKRQILRNLVNPEIGLYILNCARNIITKQNVNQTALWN